MTASLPIIDLSAPDATAAIGAAARGIGFFYITGHGLSDAALAEIFAQSRRLFALSPAELAPIALTGRTGNRGHVGIRGESLDPTRPADLKEAFNIGFEMPDGDPDTAARRHFRAPNLWPDLPGFRAAVMDHFAACHAIGRRLHRAFAADLGLPPAWFEDKLDQPMATLRLLHYPPRPDRMEPGQLGAGEHTDYGCVTLLLTDDAGGLQVRRRDGTWIEAPHVSGAFVCNIGDCLMRWTSDIYVSTPHRVVNPAGRERYSVAFFLDPNPGAIVAPLPGLPPTYAPILAEDYLRSRLDATYAGAARPA